MEQNSDFGMFHPILTPYCLEGEHSHFSQTFVHAMPSYPFDPPVEGYAPDLVSPVQILEEIPPIHPPTSTPIDQQQAATTDRIQSPSGAPSFVQRALASPLRRTESPEPSPSGDPGTSSAAPPRFRRFSSAMSEAASAREAAAAAATAPRVRASSRDRSLAGPSQSASPQQLDEEWNRCPPPRTLRYPVTFHSTPLLEEERNRRPPAAKSRLRRLLAIGVRPLPVEPAQPSFARRRALYKPLHRGAAILTPYRDGPIQASGSDRAGKGASIRLRVCVCV